MMALKVDNVRIESKYATIGIEMDIPVLVVCTNLRRNFWVREDRKFPIRLWGQRRALNVLVRPESDVHRWITHGLQQLRTGMFVEHPFTEGPEFLPFVTTILRESVPIGDDLMWNLRQIVCCE